MARRIHFDLLLASFAALTIPGLAAEEAPEEDGFDRTPEKCVSVQRIDRTEVIDDQTIVFYMRGNEVYRNYLTRNCPGLERAGKFMYRITGNRLCGIDTITVLEQIGSRLDRGFTCGLGEFHPITEEEVADLELAKERGIAGESDAIEVEAVELPEGEQD